MAKNTLSSSIHIADWKKELSEMLIFGMLTPKIRKVTIAMLVGMFLSLLTSTRVYAYESGKCGDNISWSLSDSGNLILKGSGKMYDYSMGNTAPWGNGKRIKTLKIYIGVESIGDYAFDLCTGLTSVNIPSSVTSIGDYAFGGCTGLTSVNIPSSVTSIGDYAFNCCTGLTSVKIGTSVTSIGEAAFNCCSGLTSVELGLSVDYIGKRAFYGCSRLTGVEIPSSVSNIDIDAFGGCLDLVSMVVDESNTNYDSRDNCNSIIETASNKLIAGCKMSFIPNSVTEVGDYAFDTCTGLISIRIPKSVTNIGFRAFHYCTGLTSIVVDDGNANYDSRNNCNAIIETTTNKLLIGCNNTVIPNTVTSIDSFAFYGLTELQSVMIPGSVENIANVAFYICPGLTSIVVDERNAYYDSRENCNAIVEKKSNSLILGCKNSIIPNSVMRIARYAFNRCVGLTHMEIPNSVTSIDASAFAYCGGLARVKIGKSVESIGENAFYCCYDLVRVESLAEIPPVCKMRDVFNGVDTSTCVLVVPDGCVDAYRQADGWRDFLNITSETGGIGDLDDSNVTVTSVDGKISIAGVADAIVDVYNTSGALLYSGRSHNIAVPNAGIYFVRINGKTQKVVVR